MGTNGFRDDELVSRKVKVGNEWQTRVFPVVGGRLRLAHEGNEALSLQTELVSWDGQYAVFKCCAVTGKGNYVGYGTANSQRDARLAESLIELAETRSVARALRFAGFGLEYTGAEEVSHVTTAEPEREQTPNKEPELAFPQGSGNGKGETKALPSSPAERPTPQSCGNGKATQAQCRALYALTRKAHYTQADIEGMLSSMGAATFEDLTRETASKLIGSLQTEIAA
jgi:hypothetical protein